MKLKIHILAAILIFFFLTLAHAMQPGRSMKEESNSVSGFKPTNGVIPNRATALAVAIAILDPIYGTMVIERQKPFFATLRDDTWVVRGTLRNGTVGGVAEIHISKINGRVTKIAHGK